MQFLYQPFNNVYYNLACEEYFLKNKEEDVCILWRSAPSIVIGKHQNAMAEINYPFVLKNNIPVARRLSGGGTVFHDWGNLNFCFIQKGDATSLVDFKKFTRPIIEFLSQSGVMASFEGKNDLRVDGLKISGNAEHVYKNKVLHHGTLLFQSDIEFLREAIKPTSALIIDKAVQSLRSRVANISSFMDHPVSVEMFSKQLFDFLLNSYHGEVINISNEDEIAIRQLVETKYATWEWNYAYSPDYTFARTLYLDEGILDVYLEVGHGIIKEARLSSTVNNQQVFQGIASQLKGARHCYEDIRTLISQYFTDLKDDKKDDLILNAFF